MNASLDAEDLGLDTDLAMFWVYPQDFAAGRSMRVARRFYFSS